MIESLAVKAIILNKKMGKILLVKRADDDDVDPGAWENAGGEINDQEDLLEGLLREVREEVQIKVVPERILYASLKRGEGSRLILAYLCETTETEVALSPEHQEYKWADKSLCKEMLKGGIAADFIENGIYDMEWSECRE